MSERNVTVDDAIAFLNEVLALDPAAVSSLFKQRVPCKVALAQHPTVQVRGEFTPTEAYDVGPLGILNGLFGVDHRSYGFIAAVFEDDGLISRFIRTPEDDAS
jgi:hypothetical protein